MQIALTGRFGPTNEAISTTDMPWSRRPGETRHWPISQKNNVLQVFAHWLAITKVMVMFDQAIE